MSADELRRLLTGLRVPVKTVEPLAKSVLSKGEYGYAVDCGGAFYASHMRRSQILAWLPPGASVAMDYRRDTWFLDIRLMYVQEAGNNT